MDKALFYQKFAHNYGYFFSDSKILAQFQSPYQKIVIVKTKRFGKILNIDGFNNSSEEDGHIYDEMITHVPMLAHPKAENVLLIGGGDCCTNRELVKHSSLKHIDMVELDKAVIEMHKKHIGSGLYQHPKLSLHIGDGAKFVRKTDKTFDIVIVDTTDCPNDDYVNPCSASLFSQNFFKDCFRVLSAQGILVIQSDGGGIEYRGTCKKTLLKLQNIFPKAYLYLACIPSLYPGFMTFCIASKKYDPRFPLREPDFESKYYSPEIHKAAFALPPEIKDFLTY